MRARLILYSARMNTTCVFTTIATAAKSQTPKVVSRRKKNVRHIVPLATLPARRPQD